MRDPASGPKTADAVRFVSNGAGSPLYVHADHLATPQKMTDQAASLVWDKVQRPFGETFSVSGAASSPWGNPKRFPGQLHDPETGFHYNYFRDYDPTTGRYLQSDPIGLDGGLNTYAYVSGNPVRWGDPLGLYVCTCKATGYGTRNEKGEKVCQYRCTCRDNCGNEKAIRFSRSEGTSSTASCVGQWTDIVPTPPRTGLNPFSFDTDNFWDRVNPFMPPPSDFMDDVEDIMQREPE